jgi:hypothetical protein
MRCATEVERRKNPVPQPFSRLNRAFLIVKRCDHRLTDRSGNRIFQRW